MPNGKRRPKGSDDDTDFAGHPEETDGDEDTESDVPVEFDVRELQAQQDRSRNNNTINSQKGMKLKNSIQPQQKSLGSKRTLMGSIGKNATPVKNSGKKQQGSAQKSSGSIVQQPPSKTHSKVTKKTAISGKSVKSSGTKQSAAKIVGSNSTKRAPSTSSAAAAKSKPSSTPAKQNGIAKKEPSLPIEADGISARKPTNSPKKQAVSKNAATTSKEVVSSGPSMADATVKHPRPSANKLAPKKKWLSANTELDQQSNRLPSDLPASKQHVSSKPRQGKGKGKGAKPPTAPTRLRSNSLAPPNTISPKLQCTTSIPIETQELTPPTFNVKKQGILSAQVLEQSPIQSMAEVSQLPSSDLARTIQETSSPTPTGDFISSIPTEAQARPQTDPSHPIETIPMPDLESSSTNQSADKQRLTNNLEQLIATPAAHLTSRASAH
jgi:hypothetical protein